MRFVSSRRDRRVDPRLGHRRPVDCHLRQQGARDRVRAHTGPARRGRVISDEDHRGKARVDALHHAERPWERAHDRDGNVVRKTIDEQRLLSGRCAGRTDAAPRIRNDA